MGIGPTRPAWKAGILPLNYTRMFFVAVPYQQRLYIITRFSGIVKQNYAIFYKNIKKISYFVFPAIFMKTPPLFNTCGGGFSHRHKFRLNIPIYHIIISALLEEEYLRLVRERARICPNKRYNTAFRRARYRQAFSFPPSSHGRTDKRPPRYSRPND